MNQLRLNFTKKQASVFQENYLAKITLEFFENIKLSSVKKKSKLS